MVNDRWRTNVQPYTPKEVKGTGSGLRPSAARLIGMLDTKDPAFQQTAIILASMVTAGVEIDEAAIEIAIKMGRQQASNERAAAVMTSAATPQRLWPEQDEKASIVYYIRRGELIKIGTTTRPDRRFQALVPDEILAWEPGGLHEEMLRHQQFEHLRQGDGEYFRADADLMRHCRKVRQIHGAPSPRWRTTANVQHGIRGRLPLPPLPSSLETMSVPQAAAAVGISSATIYAWIRRGKLKAAGLGEGKRAVYYIEQVRFLAERSNARKGDDSGASQVA